MFFYPLRSEMSHNTTISRRTAAIPALFVFIAAVSCFSDRADQPVGVEWGHIYDSLFVVAEQHAGTDTRLAEMYLTRAGEMINPEIQHVDHARFHLLKGRILYYRDDYLTSVLHIDSALNILINQSDLSLLAKAYSFRAYSQQLLGNFMAATESWLETIRLYNITCDKIQLAGALTALGLLHLQQNDYSKAGYYIEHALTISASKPVSLPHATVLVALGRLLMAQGALENAEDKFRQAYQIRIQCADIRHIASSMNTLAEVLTLQDRYQEAIDMLQETEPIYQHLNDKTALSYVFTNYVNIYNAMHQFDSALIYAQKSIIIGQELGNLIIQSTANRQMAEIYEKMNQPAKALEHYRKFHHSNNMIQSNENKRVISNIEYQHELFSKSKDNEILIQKNKIRNQQNLILTITSLTLIIAMIAIFIRLRSKNNQLHNNQIILEKEKSITEAREQLHQQEKMLLKSDLELRNKELTSKAVEMLHHVELLQSLSEKLKKLRVSDQYVDIKDIINELNLNTRTNAWDEFHTAFNNVHNDFYNRLLDICPELSSTEIKIAALLRLNLCTKDIAAISYKSESAVKTARHRLRQKLNLDPENNLINFLMRL